MIHSKKTGIVAITIAAITFYSCKKSALDSIQPVYQSVKVYDDTTASAENASIKITSGSNKLFMVYGKGAPFAFAAGGIFLNEYQAKIMATDFKGEVLWQNAIPTNLDVNNVIALNDGGCATVSFNYWGNSNHTLSHLYLNRFDGNGKSTSADSLLVPSSIATNYYLLQVGGCLSTNGNLILCLTINNNGTPTTCIGEYSFDSGWIWCKTYKLLADATSEICSIYAATQCDNGYVFGIKASKNAPGASINAVLLKTNLTGDTLWTWKQKDSADVWMGSSVVDFNQDIYFGYNLGPNGNVKGYISQIDVNGNLLNTIATGNQLNYYITSVKVSSSGNIYLLSNKYGNSVNSYTDPIFELTNTNLLQSDASLNIYSNESLQSQTPDFFPASCRMSDGKTASFGLIQPKGKTYYKPTLIVLE